MKPNRLILFLIIISLYQCNITNKKSGEETPKTENDSIQIIRQTYENSRDVTEYEIPVIKGTNMRHGIQKRFYLHGSLYSTIPYVYGRREGIAYTYYPAAPGNEPVVWKEQPYVKNELDGVCRRYHRDGTLQAEYEYKNGLPGTGLKEFTESGKPVKQPSLILAKTKTAAGYYVTARLSDDNEKVEYFIGDLVEGKFLPDNLKGLQVRKGVGETVADSSTKSVTITAVFYTRYSNQCVLSRTIYL